MINVWSVDDLIAVKGLGGIARTQRMCKLECDLVRLKALNDVRNGNTV